MAMILATLGSEDPTRASLALRHGQGDSRGWLAMALCSRAGW